MASDNQQPTNGNGSHATPRPTTATTHNAIFLETLRHGNPTSTTTTKLPLLNGSKLTLGHLIAIARHHAHFDLDEATRRPLVEASNKALLALVQTKERTVYGVTTNFGGNAGASLPAEEVDTIAQALEGLLAGIVPSIDSSSHNVGGGIPPTLPTAWVRGAMLLRVNNLLRAHSCVRWPLITSLRDLLLQDATPVVPTQGSISASGDLMPLAYIAYALSGHPGVLVDIKGERVPASEALKKLSMPTFTYQPKEVLAITNGTAVAASVAAQALYDAHGLLALTQVITAMACEAGLGFKGPFEAFLHDEARPHPGQVQVAGNLRKWLGSSGMLQDGGTQKAGSPVELLLRAGTSPEAKARINVEGSFLKQDRYPVRTAPQWIGPVLEDFLTAHRTLEIEINSSTDNPLMDPTTSRVLHGGNFQATAVTNATEKTRDGLATLARLLFAQQSELLNATMSNGLEPCLAACDGPNRDGGLKGLDIANASYMSELAWLAGRANHCVVSAEMHNQSVNSLALVSARYTSMAVDVMMKMCANALYVVLQAIDLRLAFIEFLGYMTLWIGSKLDYDTDWSTPAKQEMIDPDEVDLFPDHEDHFLMPERKEQHAIITHLVEAAAVEFLRASHLDVDTRASNAGKAIHHLLKNDYADIKLGRAASRERWSDGKWADDVKHAYYTSRRTHNFYAHVWSYSGKDGNPSQLTKSALVFVRKTLGVKPWAGVRPHPGSVLDGYEGTPAKPYASSVVAEKTKEELDKEPAWTKTVGGRVTKLYEAIKDGKVAQAIKGFFEEEEQGGATK